MSNQLKLKFSSSSQVKYLLNILSKKEKLALYSAVFILLASLITWSINFYFSSTQLVPDAGGEYTEGMMGQPLYVNPVLSQSNEVDSALSQLLFSSLLKYDNKGDLINDLAESWNVSEDGTTYTVKLKPGIKWHDNTNLTAQDVAFTVKVIQDPNYKSTLRGDWQDVSVDIVDDLTINFKLNKAYAPFINKLTFGILPKHIFEEVPGEKFLLSDFNLKPIGSGPFMFSDFKKDQQNNIISYQLVSFPEYFEKKSYLEKINLNFYPDEDQLLNAYSKKEINGFGAISYQEIEKIKNRKDTTIADLQTPRYFAIFFNQTKSVPLVNKEIRQALSYGTNREEIISQVFSGYARPVYTPVLESFGQFNSNSDAEKYSFDLEKANKILDESGWKKGDNGIRQKNNSSLEISLITTQWPDLVKTAEIVKNQWEKIGVKVELTNLAISDIQQNFIKPREYQAILFGQEYFGNDPDPYYFWHSSGKKDPGRNISLYDNEKVDTLIEEARETQDLKQRKDKYNQIEKLISEDSPAVFLYSPEYVYVTNKKIKGIDTQSVVNPAYRLQNIQNWYIKTKRIKK